MKGTTLRMGRVAEGVGVLIAMHGCSCANTDSTGWGWFKSFTSNDIIALDTWLSEVVVFETMTDTRFR